MCNSGGASQRNCAAHDAPPARTPPPQLCEHYGLEFVGNAAFDEFYQMQTEAREGKKMKKSAGTTLLKERLLREATVLDTNILKV